MKKVSTPNAPSAIGPYSQAYIAGDFLFTSGQGGINPADGSVVGGGIEAQTEQTMKNLDEIFKEAGTDFAKAVKTTCFLADMSDFAAFNSVYERYFTGKPARTCVAVKTLPLGILCEVEAVVYLANKGGE
jgi:2-iminobutanoate/2-iminopropanoate deaminase